VVTARLTHNVDMVAAGDVEALEAGVTESAKITDEVLRFELREDLDTLKDHHATPEATRQAIYRLGSRLPRILWVYLSQKGFRLFYRGHGRRNRFGMERQHDHSHFLGAG
jgi:hypothetical protein